MTPGEKFLKVRDFLIEHRNDYEFACENFARPVFDEFNWGTDFFDAQAKGNDTPALWIVEEDGSEIKVSFSEMSDRSNKVANYLRSLGVKRGDSLLMMLRNQVELWETMLAAMKLGVIVIPCAPLLTVDDLADRIDRGKARVVVTNFSETAKFSAIDGDYLKVSVGGAAGDWICYEDAYGQSVVFEPKGVTKASDPLLLYFTSGTTSKPKLVLHSHESYPVGHLTSMYWIGLQGGDIHYNISSPGWAKHAYSSFFSPWNAGATIFVYNYERFDAKTVLDVIGRCRVTTLCAPPTVWRMMVQEDLTKFGTSLREVVSAGEPLNAEIIEHVERVWGLAIRDGYGQTETTLLVGNLPGRPIKPGAMGQPMPGYRVVLLRPDGESVDEGEVALDLAAGAIGLMLGYQDNAERQGEVMRDGFYHTGDTAFIDADGYFTFVGRNDDVFKSSDYRISPFELESILIEHEAVVEAAVVPSPDAIRLSVPKAFIVLAQDHTADAATALSILHHCRTRLASFKRIRRIEFRELPKTISGKIRRVEFRLEEAKRDPEVRNPLEFWEEDFAEHFRTQTKP